MSNTLCVSQRTVLRRMLEYGLKIRNFSNISDNKLDSDVLALTNDYPFCCETILRVLLKGRGIIIQCYRFRDSTHHVSEVGTQSKMKGRLKRTVYNAKGTNHLRILTLTINLSSGTWLYLGQLTTTVGCPYHWNAWAIIKLLQSCHAFWRVSIHMVAAE